MAILTPGSAKRTSSASSAGGYDVMVDDIMFEGPKHHHHHQQLYPNIFKKNMSCDEANDLLALGCRGNIGLKSGRAYWRTILEIEKATMTVYEFQYI